MTDFDRQLFWIRIFFNGGAAVVAAICIFLATRKEARGAFKWLLWALAIFLLIVQAGCWMLAKGIGNAVT